MGLDGVEIVMRTEETFGIEIPDKTAAQLLTPATALSKPLQSALMPPCPSRRPDHRCTKAIDSRRRSSVVVCGSTTASV